MNHQPVRLDDPPSGPNEPPGDPARSLAREAAQGDVAAFEALYRMEGGRVLAIVWRMTGDRQLAEDLTQDCFLRAWQRLPSFTGEGPFGAWLRRIAINVVLDARRRAVRESIRGADDPVRLPINQVETSIDLDRAIRALPEGARTVFVLHDVEGFRHEEIATMLGVTSGTSKAQLHRARALLRGELA